jgi:hypothetical protein
MLSVAEPVAESDAAALQRVELAHPAAVGLDPQPEVQVVDGSDGLSFRVVHLAADEFGRHHFVLPGIRPMTFSSVHWRKR